MFGYVHSVRSVGVALFGAGLLFAACVLGTGDAKLLPGQRRRARPVAREQHRPRFDAIIVQRISRVRALYRTKRGVL